MGKIIEKIKDVIGLPHQEGSSTSKKAVEDYQYQRLPPSEKAKLDKDYKGKPPSGGGGNNNPSSPSGNIDNGASALAEALANQKAQLEAQAKAQQEAERIR